MERNKAKLAGKIISAFTVWHNRINLVTFDIEIMRKSGTSDIIPIVMEKYRSIGIHEGDVVCISGRCCSYSTNNHILSYIFADSISIEESDPQNYIIFDGVVCKSPVVRKTPQGKDIADILVCIPSPKPHSNLLRCIAWGDNALLFSHVEPGDHIMAAGRIQRRIYSKATKEGLVDRVTFEFSLASVRIGAQGGSYNEAN